MLNSNDLRSSLVRQFSRVLPSIVVLMILGCTLNAQDTALVRERFDYAEFNPLNWIDGGSGWSGPWIRAIGDDIVIRKDNLNYTDTNQQEGYHLSIDITNVGTRYNRDISNIPDNGEELWLSVLMQFNPGSNLNNVGNITLTKDGSQVFSFGRIYGSGHFGLAWSGGATYTTNIETQGLHWLVVRILFSDDSNDERAWVWIDPPAGGVPELMDATIRVPQPGQPRLFMNDGIDGVQIKAEGMTPLFMDMDELSIGRSFAAVDPYMTTGITDINNESKINLYPNPARGFFNLSMNLDRPDDLTFSIFALNGNQICHYGPRPYPAGHSVIGSNTFADVLPTGIYWVLVKGTSVRERIKLVVVH